MTDENSESISDYIIVAGRRRWFDRIRPSSPPRNDETQSAHFQTPQKTDER